MILTKQNGPKGKHRRGNNQNVLDDISNTSQRKNQNYKQATPNYKNQVNRKAGKENAIEFQKNRNDMTTAKSNSFTSGAFIKRSKMGNRKNNDYENDDLDVRFVNDIDSLVPPRYNPDTRTYFKCSIYSPSNRLYTVNEEANSTISDAGEQFTSSQIKNGYKISGQKLSQKLAQAHLSDRKNEENLKIEEEENDDEDACDVSEGMIIPQTPQPKVMQ